MQRKAQSKLFRSSNKEINSQSDFCLLNEKIYPSCEESIPQLMLYNFQFMLSQNHSLLFEKYDFCNVAVNKRSVSIF